LYYLPKSLQGTKATISYRNIQSFFVETPFELFYFFVAILYGFQEFLSRRIDKEVEETKT